MSSEKQPGRSDTAGHGHAATDSNSQSTQSLYVAALQGQSAARERNPRAATDQDARRETERLREVPMPRPDDEQQDALKRWTLTSPQTITT